ncbi:uncharacterized protein LOC129584024 isoform X1 [Paramacrobiotus metropolitanus]|uniref:uncharacterized protein LOC129584024 isoform X1 n=1 Tax=Paramacrobiotus metropolitanus TaxID=2943436 RepID=UPI002445E0A6|nr:uncharacterized protein LOC129584024 isoform X1 [Paramacrobiotus metropolitanus]XP_055332083.1 uncharacterized protein LOC129584024 isoform X1 [Paramacrobiotus metropolitanus]
MMEASESMSVVDNASVSTFSVSSATSDSTIVSTSSSASRDRVQPPHKEDNVLKAAYKENNKLRKNLLHLIQTEVAAASAKLFVSHRLLIKAVQNAQTGVTNTFSSAFTVDGISTDVANVNGQLLRMNGQCQMLRENSLQALSMFGSDRS